MTSPSPALWKPICIAIEENEDMSIVSPTVEMYPVEEPVLTHLAFLQ